MPNLVCSHNNTRLSRFGAVLSVLMRIEVVVKCYVGLLVHLNENRKKNIKNGFFLFLYTGKIHIFLSPVSEEIFFHQNL